MKFIIYFLISVILISAARAQPKTKPDMQRIKSRYGFKVLRKQPVNYNLFVDYGADSWQPQIFLAVAVQNDVLQFEKNQQQYTARYQVSAAVRQNGNALLQENWTHKITLSEFDATNARDQYQYSAYRLSNVYSDSALQLRDGKYECLLELRDLNTRKSLNRKINFTISRDSAGYSSTKIAFLNNHPDSVEYFPLAAGGNILEFSKPYFAYIHCKKDSAAIPEVNARIYRKEKQGDVLVYQTFVRSEEQPAARRIVIPVPMDSLEEGKYRLHLSTARFDLERHFSVIWFAKPTYLYEPDLAIRPMRYILSAQEYEKAKSLSKSQLRDWLKSYWKSKDPSPGTIYNELLAEFFDRVQQANRRFSTRSKEGWETDQGKIYLLYGQPRHIENKRYATQTLPHLIWEYENNLTFVFVDKNHDGEFTLVSEKEKDN